MSTLECDVAIVGASVSGCTAATLFARTGLRVLLLERSSDPAAFKRVCTHFIQPSAVPTIDRLGIGPALVSAGAKRNRLEIWTEWGWIKGSGTSEGYNLRRQKLDPLMRSLAASTPGVGYLPGCTATALVTRNGRVSGVETISRDKGQRNISARLVVGADGRDSNIGRLARLRVSESRNNRFTYFTYYRNLPTSPTANSCYWHVDPNLAYAFENDDDTTLLGVFLPHQELAAFKSDVEGNFLRMWESLDEAPRLRGAERVAEMRGMLRMPNLTRAAAGPGVAVVGDAALALDPIWGTGCGFAMQSAEWLVDETAAALLDGSASPSVLDAALSRYRRRHRRHTRGHALHIGDFSTARPTRLAERLFFSAAARDQQTADVVLKYLGREGGLLEVARPTNVWRALRVNANHLLHRASPQADTSRDPEPGNFL